MRILRRLLGLAFIGWCVYGGVYLPAQYGAYGREVEEEHAGKRGDSSVSDEDDSGVGEDNVGESLDD
jgi:hypothetical protein